MKKFKLLPLILALVLVFTACAGNPDNSTSGENLVRLTITSEKNVSLELGQSYTLTYDTDGTVTVEVSGGNYDSDSQKFTAQEAGTYTITVTASAEGKTAVSDKVTVTFTVASADKKALGAAIDATKSLVKSDYTGESWKALETALNSAKAALAEAGIAQEDVDAATANLNKAVSDLVANLVKAEIATDGKSFTWNETTYVAEDYTNFDAIVAQLKQLNANAQISLKSEYLPAITEILDSLDAKVKLSIRSDLKNNAKMIVESLGKYVLSAQSDDGVSYVWKLDGKEVSTAATYEFAPSEYKEYVIECTVAKGENKNVKTLTVSFIESDYVVNGSFADRITVEDNKINVNSNFGWGDDEGRKVLLPDLRLSGNFTVYFDVEFTTHEDVGVMAMFLLKENGERNDFWVAVLQHSNKLEVATAGHSDDFKPRYDMPAGTADLNKVIHVMMTRTIKDGKAYLYAYILDDDGKVIMEHDANGLYREDADALGTVQLGIQAENAHFTVSNIAVGLNDNITSKTALNKALAQSATLIEADYTAESWKALSDAKALAASATTQAEMDAAAAQIVEATNALVVAEVVKASVADGNISFGGKTYLAANYENIADIIAQIESLNADASVVLNSVYAPKVQAILEKLVSKVTLEVSGAPENNVQYLVSTLPSYTMTAETSDGANCAWFVNGKEVSSEKSYTFAPEAFGAYKISCVASKGEYTAEKEYNVTFVNAGWTANKPEVSVDNNAIKVTGNYGWDDLKGKKATTSDLTLSGNFTVKFDLTFHNQNGVNVFALFLLKANGDVNNDWVAITSQNNKLEVSCLEQKAYCDMAAGATDINAKTSYIVTREIIGDRAYISAYQLDANGNIVVTNDGTQDNGNRVSSDYTGPVVLGIQSENAHFIVENIRLDAAAKVNTKAELRELVLSADGITKTDYIESVIEELQGKIDAANGILNNAEAEQAAIDKARDELLAALAQIKPENYVEVTKAVVDADTISYSITNLTLKKSELYNFDDIADIVNKLNNSDEYAANSIYTAALNAALQSADYKIGLSTVDFDGLLSGKNYITSIDPSYNFAISSGTKDITIAWTVDGQPVGAENAYVFQPQSGKVHTVRVELRKNGAGYENESVSFTLENVAFIAADVKTPMPDRVSINPDGSFSSTTGIGWGDWEGRKVLYDDLVFNGSFSVTMDITYNANGGGANVATIHLLNADTLSPSWGGDWAYVGYGCICLHENPVRLETNWNGTGKRQSSDGGFEAVAGAMGAAASQLEVGDTFTVKLTCYRNANRQLQLVYALYNAESGEWIEFNRNEWAGDMGGGFIVGINIENVGMTASNIRYELLDATDSYIAGSVKSRAALSAALVRYQDIVASDYVNGAQFVAAYNAAWQLMRDNSANVDYDAAAKALVAAADALQKREVAVSAGALDLGYGNYSGVEKFEALFADGISASNVKWTYSLNGVAGEAVGNALTLEVGAYTDVKLSFTVDGKDYTYTYQNFNVKALALKSNNGEVTVNGSEVTVDRGAGWGAKEQLVLDGINTQNFELIFRAKYNGTPGGAYQVMCINLFGEDIRPVFGYQREDRGNRGQLGFDSNGQWADINNTDASDDAYDHIFGAATKFGLKLSQDAEGKFWITFTVYGADGSVIESRTCDYTRWYSSSTAIRFTFENINLTLSDFEVYYI